MLYIPPLFRLTTERWPFFALATSSSEPEVKSMIPSLPWPTVKVILGEREEEMRCSSFTVKIYLFF